MRSDPEEKPSTPDSVPASSSSPAADSLARTLAATLSIPHFDDPVHPSSNTPSSNDATTPLSLLERLPGELLLYTFEFLLEYSTARDYWVLCLVSKRCREVALPLLWRRIMIRDEKKAELCLSSPGFGRYYTEYLAVWGYADREDRNEEIYQIYLNDLDNKEEVNPIFHRLELLRQFRGADRLCIVAFGSGEDWDVEFLFGPNNEKIRSLTLHDVGLEVKNGSSTVDTSGWPNLRDLRLVNPSVEYPALWQKISNTTTLTHLHLQFWNDPLFDAIVTSFFPCIAHQLTHLAVSEGAISPVLPFIRSCTNLKVLDFVRCRPYRIIFLLQHFPSSHLPCLRIGLLHRTPLEVLRELLQNWNSLESLSRLKRLEMDVDWDNEVVWEAGQNEKRDFLALMAEKKVEVVDTRRFG